VTTYDAIIPAGGEIDPDFAQLAGTNNKALIPIQGQTVLERIVTALRDSGRIRRVAVTGPKSVHESPGGRMADLLLEPGFSGPDNIMRGLEALSRENAPDKVVVVTSDLPFLTSSIVKRFLDACPTDKDICLPLIGRDEYEARFPGSTSTFVKLKDGSWTAGCMYLLDVRALRQAKPYIDKIFEVRKSKIGMARLLGPAFLYRFITKSLTINDLEMKIESMLKCKGTAMKGCPPELAFDLDYTDDYEYALKHLEATL
jgi:GTP:adenosylcobinamide-phosphate guanylyltransferase